ncbi:MAG: NBR1-Ig-like domain-containing protein [Anaerolineales bacterium]
MRSKIGIFLVAVILLTVILSACNMPQGSGSPAQQTAVILTAVAQTVAADEANTNQPGDTQADTATDTPETGDEIATDTPEPSDTPQPTNTQPPTDTPIPCNLARFVKDVSIPDGTKLEPGEDFTKTWRLKNTGSCAWTSGYDIVFSGGDAMNAPAAVQITTGTVQPGNNVDVSVDLTAPNAEGTYRGNWQLRDPSGVIFDIENSNSGLFWVEIKVKEPEPTEKTVSIDFASRGQVEQGLNVRTNANNAGDTSNDVGLQGFLTFDVSGIPNGATIQSAKLVAKSYDTLGDPFGQLGCLRAYVDNYGSLDLSDFKSTGVTGALVRFCDTGDVDSASDQEMNSIGISGLESALASDNFQIRLQFKDKHTNNDGVADVFRGTFKIVVTYLEP